jgi:peptidyl-prolyl cis-trans isomerase B (cyclophilin B)
MKRGVIFLLLIILIVAVVAVFYLDIFNLKNKTEDAIAQAIHYEDIRRLSDKLLELSFDPVPEVRRRAALAIGRIGKHDEIDRLFQMLDDTASEVSEAAVFAIGLCGNQNDALRLLEMSNDFTPDLEALAVQAAGRLSDSTALDLNQTIALRLDHIDHRVREQAAYALFRGGFSEAWSKLVDVCRHDSVRPVQIAALYALVRMRIAEPIELYEEWHSDSDPYVRSLAYRGLALSRSPQDVAIIASGLNDRDNNVVSQAISSLTSIASPKAVQHMVDRYMREDNDKLKVQLLESFTRLGDSSLIDYALEDIHDEEISTNIKAAAIKYLAKTEGEEIIPLIDSLVETDHVYFRSMIADALGEIGGENVRPRLVSLFNDSAAVVRAAAFEALTEADSDNVDYYINTALKDDDYVINSYAVYKIGELDREEYVPQLMTLFEAADGKGSVRENYDMTEIKRAIVETVGKFITPEPDSLAEEILFRGLHDPDYIVSKTAAAIYKDKMEVNKDAYISQTEPFVSTREIKKALVQYRANPEAVIHTNKGKIRIELYFDLAPMTVYNFIELARKGYYDRSVFHRVVPAFVIQGGSARGDGWGGPGYSLRCEYNPQTYTRGAVGMAHAGKDTGDSQFFIALMPQPHLDGRYTLFGRVLEGMETADNIFRGDSVLSVTITEQTE